MERLGAMLLAQRRAQAAQAPPPAAEAPENNPPSTEIAPQAIEPVSDGEEQLLAEGFTEEGLATLRAFARQHGVPDLRIAAIAYDELYPPPQPVETGGTSWNLFAEPAVTTSETGLDLLLAGDDDGFLCVSVPLAIKSVRGG
jgi:hypothetical protein